MALASHHALLLGSVAASALFLGAVPALAQTGGSGGPAASAEAVAAEVQADEIIVLGSRPIAESEEAALRFQRESISLVSVVAADAIGRLPDQNIAQAISRLPGVSIQRDQGQARYVNIRGLPLNWTTLSFDGIQIVSPEGRDARFDSIPSALASKIVVEKAITPELTGETIAGNINVITRSPFDYAGSHVQAKGGVGYVDLGGGIELEGSLVASNRWETGIGNVGVLFSGSYYSREMRTDNFEIDWEVVEQDKRPGGDERVWPREIENKFYRLTRRNWSLAGRLEWEPSAGHRLFGSSTYTIFMDDEYRDNYRLDTDDQQNSAATVAALAQPCAGPIPNPLPPATTGYADICIGNTPFVGTVYGIDFDARFRETSYRQSVFINTIGGDHDFDGWRLSWRGNYTQSKDDRSQPFLLTYTQPGFGSNGTGAVNRTTVDYDLSDRKNQQFQIFRTLRSPTGVLSKGDRVMRFDMLPHSLNSITSLDAVDTTNAYTGRVTLARDTQLLGNTELRFGLQFDRRSKEAVEKQLALSGAANLTAAGIPLSLNDLLGLGEQYRGKLPLGYSFIHFNEATANSFLERAQARASYNPLLGNTYRVTEEVWSGWAMAITRPDWGSIVYGVRVENVANTGEAFAQIGSSFRPVSSESSDTNIFPSVHVNWDLADDRKLRLSFTTGAARPDYTVLRPSFVVNDANEVITGGNPFAKPEKSWGLDAYYEWYLMPRGIVSAGVFYKNTKDTLFESTTVFGSDIINNVPPPRDRSGYVFTTTVNGGKGWLVGFEGNFQAQLSNFVGDDPWWSGFGLQTNLTVVTSQATTPEGDKIRFPGASDFTVNVGPYYEKYGFSARLSYQYRTYFLSELGGPDTGGDIYWDNDAELDFSMRYAFNRNLEVYFDAANILNGAGIRWAGEQARTLEYEKFGRRFTGGFRLTM
ncbi:TonB-dependent receptor [Thermaurantiacus sp.]